MIFSVSTQAQTETGHTDPTVMQIGGGGQVWSNKNEAISLNSTYATSTPDEGATQKLRAKTFGFAITDGDDIDGVEVKIVWSANNADRIFQSQVKLTLGGVLIGTSASTGSAISTVEGTTTFGGAADLWGGTWTETDIEDATFGVQFKVTETGDGTNTISVDHITISIFHSTPSGATVFTSNSTGGGAWNAGTTWDQTNCASSCIAGTDFPSTTDDAEILGGDAVTIPGSFSAEVLDIKLNSDYSSTQASTLTFSNNTSTLTVGNDFEVFASTAQTLGAVHTVNLNQGTVTIGNNLVMTADNFSGTQSDVQFNVGGGTLTVTNDITLGSDNILADAEIDLTTSSSTLIIGGSINEAGIVDRGQLINIGSDCTVEYNGSGAQTIVTDVGSTAISYDNLTLSTGGTKTCEGAVTVNDDLTIADGVTLASANFDLSVGGNWINNETTASAGFTEGTGTVIFNGGSAQTISHGGGTETFYNLTISNTSGGVSLSDGINLTNTLTLTTGVLTTTGQTFTLISDASSSARIGEITGGSITGNVTVQTFYGLSSGGYSTGWHELSSCIDGSTVNDYQDDFQTCGYSGAEFTSADCGGFASTGYYFDESLDGGESSGGWQVVTS
ncbi:MAG: hypothetical protein HRT71_20255, partial [Flavobacteriales bacterium]|nr:hypothetical protein [Flavobacteriales bacterium]